VSDLIFADERCHNWGNQEVENNRFICNDKPTLNLRFEESLLCLDRKSQFLLTPAFVQACYFDSGGQLSLRQLLHDAIYFLPSVRFSSLVKASNLHGLIRAYSDIVVFGFE